MRQNIEGSTIGSTEFRGGNTKLSVTQTLGADFTVDADMPQSLFLDPDGTARAVILPAEGTSRGLEFEITNTGSAAVLTIQEDSETTDIGVVGAGDTVKVKCDGTTWYATGGLDASPVVATTATTLTVSRAAHDGKVIVVNSAAPIAVTIPAATGSGAKYAFKIGVAATATGHTLTTTSVIEGVALGLTTSSDNVVGWSTTATDKVVTINGTTKGGLPGDLIEYIDAESGVYQINAVLRQTGSVVTPFSAS